MQICIQVIDLYCIGDRFAVYYNGVFLFNTSVPPANDCLFIFTDPHIAINGSDLNRGQGSTISSLSGSANVIIIPIPSPFSGGILALSSLQGPCPVSFVKDNARIGT